MPLFEVGDEAIYTPNIENLPPAWQRKRDVCTLLNIHGNYFDVEFVNNPSLRLSILKDSIAHAPYSRKNVQEILKASLRVLPEAVQAREARQVMLWRTPLSVRIPGPPRLVQQFVTSQRRTRYPTALKNM